MVAVHPHKHVKKISGGPLSNQCWPLATRSKKVEFWPFLETFWPLWRTSWLKRKKMNKTKNVYLVEDVGKLIYFMICIPKFHILATRGKISGIFTILYMFQPFFRTFWLKRKKMEKKLHLVSEDVANFFYFMTFIPKFHILATRGKKSWILTILVHVSCILEDLLTEMKKKIIKKEVASCQYLFLKILLKQFLAQSCFWSFKDN